LDKVNLIRILNNSNNCRRMILKILATDLQARLAFYLCIPDILRKAGIPAVQIVFCILRT